MFELFDRPNMIDEFQNRVRPMNDCLLRVKVAYRQDKQAMGKACLVIDVNFPLCSVSISFFLI